MAEAFFVNNEAIDSLLADVVTDNQDKVVGWIKGEPGAWGFLAGQAVITVRKEAGRDLANAERGMVWSRMWWWLEEVKARVGGEL
jgi:Asp-tRNA(Asn)/Glu-tRNA(Gln) amidotransferase B subunit